MNRKAYQHNFILARLVLSLYNQLLLPLLLPLIASVLRNVLLSSSTHIDVPFSYPYLGMGIF